MLLMRYVPVMQLSLCVIANLLRLGMLLMRYVPVMQLSLCVIASPLRLGMLLELFLLFRHALWLFSQLLPLRLVPFFVWIESIFSPICKTIPSIF